VLTTRRSTHLIIAALAATFLGIALYSQLDRVADSMLGAAVFISFALTFGGLLGVLVGGICFARSAPLLRTFWFCCALAAVAIGSIYGTNPNIHGRAAILIIVLPGATLISAVVFLVAVAGWIWNRQRA
jgi:hypothetical protein